MSQQTILSNALANFDRAAAALSSEVDPDILIKIRRPKERIELTLNPQLDDHKVHHYQAFMVRHNDALGPAKGGIRMTSSVTLDDVTGLAMEMTWKCALIGVPFGGGKSGIVADARTLSPGDKQTIIRNFARNAHRHIAPTIYVPAPDMGTNERDMGYLKDTICFSAGDSTTTGCYVTGKPVILGGIPGRRQATGRGVAICVKQLLAQLGLEPAKATAVVQGAGNVGGISADELHRLGLKIIGISDITGALYQPKGLDIPRVLQWAEKTGGVKGFDGGEAIDGGKLLELPCDVLIPAAAANQIVAENAARISARAIVEGANSPTTPQADEILLARGIRVIPDILANAGGVFTSYLEYTQETQQEQMTEQEVNQRLGARMADRFAAVQKLAQDRRCTLRDAAMLLAVRSVTEAVLARGLLP